MNFEACIGRIALFANATEIVCTDNAVIVDFALRVIDTDTLYLTHKTEQTTQYKQDF